MLTVALGGIVMTALLRRDVDEERFDALWPTSISLGDGPPRPAITARPPARRRVRRLDENAPAGWSAGCSDSTGSASAIGDPVGGEEHAVGGERSG